MKNEPLDDLLKQVLIPRENPSDDLNQNILNQVEERETMKHKKLSAVIAAVAIAAGTSITAFAAYHFMSPAEVADRLNDDKLAQQFEIQEQETAGEEMTYESQSCGGYKVTLLGILSGADYSQFPTSANGEIRSDRTYCAVAIRREDGAAVDESQESFFVSPLIGSLNPAQYNAASLCGNYSQYVEDGVLYRIMECDNIEYFADQNLYLCVTDTTFYDSNLYNWNASAKTIMRNPEYAGLNALFTLKLDAAKADPAKAKALIEDIDRLAEADGEEIEMSDAEKAADEFLDKLTTDNLEQYCVRIEDTVQTVKYGADGAVSTKPYTVSAPGHECGGEYASALWIYADWQRPGMHITGGSYSEEGLSSLCINTYYMNDDGTVTFAIYVPKDVSIYSK